MRDERRRERRVRWLSRVGVAALRVLGATWRVRFLNPEIVHREHAAGRPVIYVLWHGQLLPLLWAHRNQSIALMISEHHDGEIIARIAIALGFRTVRGSTSRGAARVLLSASREVEAGADLAVTPDGPRGPARSVAPGAAAVSRHSGAAMVPVGAGASAAWRLRSWDRFLIPKPFARINVAYAEPIRAEGGQSAAGGREEDAVRLGIDMAAERATIGNASR